MSVLYETCCSYFKCHNRFQLTYQALTKRKDQTNAIYQVKFVQYIQSTQDRIATTSHDSEDLFR